VTRLDRYRLGISLLALLLLAGCSRGPDSAARSARQFPSLGRTGLAEQLGADGRTYLRTLMESGRLVDSRWPDFSDYRGDATKFYEGYGGALPWVTGMQATPQSTSNDRSASKFCRKGLSPEDYDSSRWARRLALLKPAIRDPKDEDIVNFDAALTVSAMRYISALHIGRVNPQRLDFAVNVADRRYDLPEFLRDDVIHASDVSACSGAG